MDDWRDLWIRTLDRWQRWTPRQRFLSSGGLAIALLTMIWLSAPQAIEWDTIADTSPLTSADVARIQKAWRKAGLTTFQREAQQWRVPKSEHSRYLAAIPALNETSLEHSPERERSLLQPGLFNSQDQVEQMRDFALRQEVRRVLKAIPAIADVDVIWARSRGRHSFSSRSKVTATISVKTRAADDLTPSLAQSLRTAVAGMVPDLDGAEITVLDQTSGLAITDNSDDELIEHQKRRHQERLAKSVESQIRDALAAIPGLQVSVAATPSGNSIQHHVARPVWKEPASSNAPTLLADDLLPETFGHQPLTSEIGLKASDSHESQWRIVVTVPVTFWEAHWAQQWAEGSLPPPDALSPDGNATNTWHSEEERLHQRVQGIVWKQLPHAEIAVVTSNLLPTNTAAREQLPFSAWPHLLCAMLATAIAFPWKTTSRLKTRTVFGSSLIAQCQADESRPLSDQVTFSTDATTELMDRFPPPVETTLTQPDVKIESDATFTGESPSAVWKRIQQCPAHDLAAALKEERSQTVAVFLAQLPATRASACLALLATETQSEIIRRLKTLTDLSPEMTEEVTLAVASRLKQISSPSVSPQTDSPKKPKSYATN